MERYFLGSNTHSGFAGFYDEVTDNINRVYLLKGGPITRVCLLYCFVLSPLTLLRAVPHHHLTLSVKELTYSSN